VFSRDLLYSFDNIPDYALKDNKQGTSTSCGIGPADGEEVGEITSGEGKVGI
jgi:hypothetical protein